MRRIGFTGYSDVDRRIIWYLLMLKNLLELSPIVGRKKRYCGALTLDASV